MAVAEGAHELGRSGSIRAKRVLQQLLGNAIDLPFNAYDHTRILTFRDVLELGGETHQFSFDLGGNLRRSNPERFDGQEVVELFVEVKTRRSAGDLLADYREFLRRAAVVIQSGHSDAWFIFYTTIPFGSSRGAELVDGSMLRECVAQWPPALRGAAELVGPRIALIIATDSFVNLLTRWVRNDA